MLIIPNQPITENWHNPRVFRSRKTRGVVKAASKPHEDFLALMTLDEDVLTIEAGDRTLVLPQPFGNHQPPYKVERTDGDVGYATVILNSALDNSSFNLGMGKGLCEVVEAAAAREGIRWDPIYEDVIREDPRNGNLQHILAARGTYVPAVDRIAILEYLKEQGEVALVDAARLASPQVDGVAVVMSLCFENHVTFDIERPLVPETVLRRTAFSVDSVTEPLSP